MRGLTFRVVRESLFAPINFREFLSTFHAPCPNIMPYYGKRKRSTYKGSRSVKRRKTTKTRASGARTFAAGTCRYIYYRYAFLLL